MLIHRQRFCQSASPAEAEEVLQGIKLRFDELGVASPEMVVVDNCCQVRTHIVRAIPDSQVVLDVYHFMKRYVSCTLGIYTPFTDNPHILADTS